MGKLFKNYKVVSKIPTYSKAECKKEFKPQTKTKIHCVAYV